MRIMGLDFGSKTVGVAISDELLLTAQGIEIIRRKDENKLRQTLARIEELIVEYGVEEIVLGLPKNMNATEGIRVELTNEFKEKLERRTGLTVHTWDERLTTVAADKAMIEAGIRREKRKDYASSWVLGRARCTLPLRRQRVQTFMRLAEPLTITRTLCTLGAQVRWLLRLEWLTLLPFSVPFSQISQNFPMKSTSSLELHTSKP